MTNFEDVFYEFACIGKLHRDIHIHSLEFTSYDEFFTCFIIFDSSDICLSEEYFDDKAFSIAEDSLFIKNYLCLFSVIGRGKCCLIVFPFDMFECGFVGTV